MIIRQKKKTKKNINNKKQPIKGKDKGNSSNIKKKLIKKTRKQIKVETR